MLELDDRCPNCDYYLGSHLTQDLYDCITELHNKLIGKPNKKRKVSNIKYEKEQLFGVVFEAIKKI
tara:strand:- start:5 stop:202 length:198 start_codon:yes stop_codon:yes gene_type:complete